MALKTASIKNQTSGLRQTLRISIMSRHTLNDGVTPYPEINMGSYDMWMTELARPPKLIGAYYRNEISWAEFAEQFNAYLLLARPQEVLQTVIN
ncbi:MAG: hypothetical protein PHW95_05580, partial [Patescibacteria group bacterium]|nr:hypothetical protein [Patescibacteria group bacterium]